MLSRSLLILESSYVLLQDKCYRTGYDCLKRVTKMPVVSHLIANEYRKFLPHSLYPPLPPSADEGEEILERGHTPPLSKLFSPRPPKAGEGDKGVREKTPTFVGQ